MEMNLQNCAKLSEKMNSLEIYNDSHKLSLSLEDIEHFYINYFSRNNPKKGVEILKLVARQKSFT
jgi:hypothetical protein